MDRTSRRRTRLFLSYSHRDVKPYLEELRPYLKSLTDRGLVDLWSDHRIAPSERWHQEIQGAIESAAAAVLLVSQDFLASDYIREHEVPPLERAGIPIACLFLKPSLVEHEGMTFDTGSGSDPVRLTEYQGLNSPERPLSALDENERAQVYVKAAEWIAQAVPQPGRQPEFQQPPLEQRRELSIHLQVRRDYLERTYFTSGIKIREYRSPWPPLRDRLAQGSTRGPVALGADLGSTLFQTLLGDDALTGEVLAATFESAPGIKPRPILGPVRVRIAAREPLLRTLPWHQTAWEDARLWDSAGWTFELMDFGIDTATDETAEVLLKAPCPVLLLASGTGSEGTPALDAHFRALEEALHRAWPAYSESPRVVRNIQAMEQAFQERRPRIIYCFLADLALDTQKWVDRLRAAWGAQPPQVLLVNLVAERLPEDVEALGGLHPQVPFILLQWATDAGELEASALDWLHTLLEGGEDVDPVCAFHQYGVERALAWGAYRHWRTRTAAEPPREKLAHLLLDRKLQRALVRSALDELVHEGDRRLCCLFGYGAEGNLVDLLPAQLFEHLRRNARDVAHVSRLKLRLPEASKFDAGTVAAQVRQDLGLAPRESLGEALRARRPRVPRGRRPVLLLEWGVRGDARIPLSKEGVEAWLEFCAGILCAQCPPDLRLLSLLSLESPEEKHGRIKTLVNGLRAESRFRDRAFRLELLAPLGRINANDLADFLDRRGNSACPDDMIPLMPELIVARTGGHFEGTLALIEEAERRSWYALYDELTVHEPEAAPETREEEGTL